MNGFYQISTGVIHPQGSRSYVSGDAYLVLLILEGSCYVQLEGKQRLCTPADLMLMKPQVVQTLSAAGEETPCSVTAVHVSPDALVHYSDDQCDLAEKFAFVPYQTAVIHGQINAVVTLKNLVTRLAGLAMDELQLGLSIYENSLLSSFLVLLLRACAQSDRIYQTQRRKHLLIDDVFLFIRQHLTEDLSIKRLEKEFFVSGEYLMRSFRATADMPLHVYIMKSRIDLSKRYILQGYPIRDVYSLCGFGSYNHFFRAFKQECGLTPKAYYRQATDVVRDQ